MAIVGWATMRSCCMTAIEAHSGVGKERDCSERRVERHLRVVVVGAGFSGLSVASRLRERGEKDFVVLERGESVGGVWRDNTYPGVVFDVPSHQK
jgi:NADPH-dependent 2,4-dienoyl-CoA reductase/sulfur reductase-like enzyme